MKRIVVPCVAREVMTDYPILVVSHVDGDIGMIYREDGRRLGLSVNAEMWWDTHLFKTSEDPKVYAEVLKAYALHCGADPDAAQVLRRFTKVTDEEYQRMVTTTAKPATSKTLDERKKTVANTAGKKPDKAAAAPAKPAAPAKLTDAEKEAKKVANLAKLKELNAKKKAERGAAGPKEKKPSASSRFCELIMTGKQTDDQIFATVQKEFGLDDSKRTYVAWYRNKLKKDGSNPPVAKQ